MLGCVIAMESEAEILLDAGRVFEECFACGKKVLKLKIFEREVLLCICGEGKVNAAAGTCAVISLGADKILNFGVAGGLTAESTKVGKVYLIEKAVQYDFDLTKLNHLPLGTLPGEENNFLPLCCPENLKFPKRALGTGDRFNDSKRDHNTLLSLGCEVRDMEGGAIAQVAKSASVPFTSVKAISDVYGSGSTTRQFQQNLHFAMENLKEQLESILRSVL